MIWVELVTWMYFISSKIVTFPVRYESDLGTVSSDYR